MDWRQKLRKARYLENQAPAKRPFLNWLPVCDQLGYKALPKLVRQQGLVIEYITNQFDICD